ncbi:hypothetical protein PTKIN_Ptkin09bG0028500 [Pterospermum kingtungense]
MDNKNGVVDISCFLLVEDSGDSELDSGPMQCDQSMDVAGADEDDAESCSCDASTTERLDDFYEEILQLDEDQDFIDCIEPTAATGSWSSCNMWSIDEALGYISADEAEDHHQEPRFGIKLCREVMDGMEDRLFWETCMAVGYP